MHYKSFSLLLLLAPLLLLTWACNHDTDEFDGPNLVDRFGAFTVVDSLSLSRQTVDFSAGETVELNATFNKRINWVAVITGMESGAVKVIEGFDNTVNGGNATWEGGTTILPLFKEENSSVQLIIPEEDSLTMTKMVEVVSSKVYEGSVFTDFETEPGADIFLGNFEFELSGESGRKNTLPAAQGDWYYFFDGNDNVVPNFFVGLIDIKSTITGSTYAPVPTAIPEELYFNAFLYADGGPHGIAVIQFIFDTNDNGLFDDGTDQTFQVDGDYPLGWEGWQHIHHPMSDVGMTEAQLSKIVAIRALLISDMNAQPTPSVPVRFGIDFMTFTEGGPLEL